MKGDGKDMAEDADVVRFAVLQTIAGHKAFLPTDPAAAIVADQQIQSSEDKNAQREGQEP